MNKSVAIALGVLFGIILLIASLLFLAANNCDSIVCIWYIILIPILFLFILFGVVMLLIYIFSILYKKFKKEDE
jgi:hypothetical protein